MRDENLGVGTDAEAVEECCFLTSACSLQIAQPAVSLQPGSPAQGWYHQRELGPLMSIPNQENPLQACFTSQSFYLLN